MSDNPQVSKGSEDLKEASVHEVEKTPVPGQSTPQEIQARFDTLRDLSENELETLNKRLVKKIDWRMMPMVTSMFLLK